ncbi:MAG: hypothetical protein QM762_18130 [Chryseolinea sp.]
MKILFTLLMTILLINCTSRRPSGTSSIQVVRFSQHPMFVDHHRRLVTVDKNGGTIDELEMYPDSGSGCDSYLFDSGEEYVLVDCNGQWFRIDKATGKLEKDEWTWRKELPSAGLGVFKRQRYDVHYELVTGEKISVNEVYKFKDPNE